MQFKIHQRKADKNNTELYKKAVAFFAEQLLSKSRRERLKLTIIIKHFRGRAKNDSGYCTQVSRNRYIIEINRKYDFPTTISTLAHEMVHVKQGVMGKLLMTHVGFKWKGKLFRSVDIDSNNDYYNTEWEIEAYKLEPELTKKFFRDIIQSQFKQIPEIE
jgi:hypothetical protein